MNGERVKKFAALLVFNLVAITPVLAASATNVTVKVTVVTPPPCSINNDQPIEVEFGDVMTTRIDGKNYKVPVNYTLSCAANAKNAMKIQVQGTGASFDSSVLQTSVQGLGIRFENEKATVSLPLNGWLYFAYPNTPAIWVVPVLQAGISLKGGEFTAASTMKLAYQ